MVQFIGLASLLLDADWLWRQRGRFDGLLQALQAFEPARALQQAQHHGMRVAHDIGRGGLGVAAQLERVRDRNFVVPFTTYSSRNNASFTSA